MRKKMMAMAAVTAMMVSAGTGSVAMAAQENDDPSKWPVVKMEVVSSTGEEAKEQEIEDALNKYLVSIDAGVGQIWYHLHLVTEQLSLRYY